MYVKTVRSGKVYNLDKLDAEAKIKTGVFVKATRDEYLKQGMSLSDKTYLEDLAKMQKVVIQKELEAENGEKFKEHVAKYEEQAEVDFAEKIKIATEELKKEIHVEYKSEIIKVETEKEGLIARINELEGKLKLSGEEVEKLSKQLKAGSKK